MTPPISIATTAAAKPTMSETRAPYIIRLSMSKPPSSSPSQCWDDGGREHVADALVLAVGRDPRSEHGDQHDDQQHDAAEHRLLVGADRRQHRVAAQAARGAARRGPRPVR